MADPGLVNSKTTSAVAPGDTLSVSISWPSGDTRPGDFTATADVGRDTDTQSVRVSSLTSPDGDEWGLPIDPSGDGEVGVEPQSVSTTHESIEIETEVTDTELNELSHYREAGDIQRVGTAYGAFRRLRRDGDDPVTTSPPDTLSPPFTARPVIPSGFNASAISPDRHAASISLALVDPRARDPISTSSEPEVIGETTTDAVAPGDTLSTAVSGVAPSSFGDYLATADVGRDSDDQLVTVSDAALVLQFRATSLALTERQIGQPQRSPRRGVERVTLPLRLTTEEAVDLLAVGSRVEAAASRQVPDGQNYLRGTTPDEELVATVSAAPWLNGVIDGEMLLVNWSLSATDLTGEFPFDASITLVVL